MNKLQTYLVRYLEYWQLMDIYLYFLDQLIFTNINRIKTRKFSGGSWRQTT